MGLDICIYHYNDSSDIGKGNEQENTYQKASEEIWKKMSKGKDYKQIPKKQTIAIRKKCKDCAKEMGLDENGMYCYNREYLSMKSLKYPDHAFNIGEFYSSYNASGINKVLRDILNGQDLYYIFQPEEKDEFVPDWKKIRERISKMRELFGKSLSQNGSHQVMECSYNEFILPDKHEVKSSEEAYQKFIEEQKRIAKDPLPPTFSSYSNISGTFFTDSPLEVTAIIPGVRKRFFAGQFLPAFYLIYKSNSLKWYLEGVEIIAETIEYICNQPDPQNYAVSWSS